MKYFERSFGIISSNISTPKRVCCKVILQKIFDGSIIEEGMDIT
ncbi:MAG: hypothetical protein QW193_04255 [Nitrososphaerales archaeon]